MEIDQRTHNQVTGGLLGLGGAFGIKQGVDQFNFASEVASRNIQAAKNALQGMTKEGLVGLSENLDSADLSQLSLPEIWQNGKTRVNIQEALGAVDVAEGMQKFARGNKIAGVAKGLLGAGVLGTGALILAKNIKRPGEA